MDSEKEIWKSVKDFPDYEISNLGRVKSYKVPHWRDPHILVPFIVGSGYYQVDLHKQKKGFSSYVHHLVLETFVEPKSDGYQTNHKNGIKTDNRVENLEWITQSENIKHAFRTGLKTIRGIMHPNAKLRNEEVIEIRRLAKSGIKQTVIAKMFKVTKYNIYCIIHHKSWNHI